LLEIKIGCEVRPGEVAGQQFSYVIDVLVQVLLALLVAFGGVWHHDDYPAALDKRFAQSLPPSRHRVFFSSFFCPILTSERRQAQLKALTKVPARAAGSLKGNNHHHHRHQQLVACLEMIAKDCAMSGLISSL
jgi:hypothetical protein